MSQCGGPSPAISRLARRAVKLGGPGAVYDAAALIETEAPDKPTPAQRDALAAMERRLSRR